MSISVNSILKDVQEGNVFAFTDEPQVQYKLLERKQTYLDTKRFGAKASEDMSVAIPLATHGDRAVLEWV